MSRAAVAGVAAVCLALAGCGGGPKYVSVSGTVKVDGKPYKNAVVSFQPMASKGVDDAGAVGSSALTDENGRFTLLTNDGKPGAAPGRHKVRIQTKRDDPTAFVDPSVGSPDDPDPDFGNKKKKQNTKVDPIPTDWYADTGGKEYTVPAGGTDQANFDIESAKPEKKK